ncbi:hypothetical protein PM082_022839 [Marasmius tenuissimus]|nr:hypothetical protein PM082_022839 [Marasmius tenuissimus]
MLGSTTWPPSQCHHRAKTSLLILIQSPIPHPPLRQDTRPQLDGDGIVSCFEEQFGDFFHLIASLGETRHVKDVSNFARHGYLTFGAVVDRNKPEILAYFPSTPPPEWFYRLLRCTAYLSQSVPLVQDSDNPYNGLVFIDEVRFSLVGTFQSNPVSSTTPAYLFAPPIPIEVVDNVYCIHYPLSDTLFFWSLDPNGQDVIYEENWEAYGIPQLEIFTWIGSLWVGGGYRLVRRHLKKKSCTLDGRQYAREHGYPELAYGNPHNPSITVVEEPDSLEDINSFPGGSKHQGYSFHPLLRRSPPPCTHDKAVGDPNDDDLIPLNQPSSEAPETRYIEADQIETCAATSSSTEDNQEGPKARNIHGLAPSRRSSQFYRNEYQPPAWPRAIYELFVLFWSATLVILSIGFDRVIGGMGRTSPENMGVVAKVETREKTTDG